MCLTAYLHAIEKERNLNNESYPVSKPGGIIRMETFPVEFAEAAAW
jgi:hypothetical protein